jgi:hypothetical protein
MTDFVLLPNYDSLLPEEILKTVHGFRSSPEYVRLSEDERSLSGMVCSALASYMERIFRDDERGVHGSDVARESSVEMLEKML